MKRRDMEERRKREIREMDERMMREMEEWEHQINKRRSHEIGGEVRGEMYESEKMKYKSPPTGHPFDYRIGVGSHLMLR